jgi:hypothetical protein
MKNKNKSTLPKQTAGDVVHAVVKGAISGIPIPIAGGVAAEIFGLVLAPPLSKRRDAWFQSLAERLKGVEARLESLGENPAFVTTVLQATQIALRTHQEEKLEALRNAVVNSTSGQVLEDDKRAVFLNLVDTFTPTHLRIVKYFQNRESFDVRTELLDVRAVQQSRKATELTNIMVEELARNGLLEDHRPYAVRGRDTGESLLTFAWTVSPLGVQFLEFITPRAGQKRS